MNPPLAHADDPRNSSDQLVSELQQLRQQVTSLKEAEQALARVEAELRRTHSRLRSVVDHAPIVLYSTDAEGTFTLSEGHGLEALGLQPGEVVGRSIYDVYGSVPQICENFEKSIAGETVSYEVDVNGQVFDTWQSPLRDEEDNIVGVIGVATDITRHARAEREARASRDELERRVEERTAKLAEQEERWRSLVENAPDLILIVSPEARIEFINRSAAGLSREEIHGTHVDDYVPAGSARIMRQTFDRVLTSGEPDSYEVAGPAIDGSMAWWRTRVGPIQRDGEIVGLMLICNDVTVEKDSQEQLEAERRFLRDMVEAQERDRRLTAYELHDGLIQHVTGALMHLEGMQHQPPLAGQLPDTFSLVLRLLRQAVAEGRQVIGGLRPPVIDELGVVAAIEYLIGERRSDELQIEFEHPPDFPRLDPLIEATLYRIVQESINNVRQHSHASRARIELAAEEGQRVRVAVEDNGVGFDPSQTPEKRYGLRGIRDRARMFHGTVSIDSRPGEGTRVVVELPLPDPQTASGHWRIS